MLIRGQPGITGYENSTLNILAEVIEVPVGE